MKFVIKVSIEAEKPQEQNNIMPAILMALPFILDSLGIKPPHSPGCPNAESEPESEQKNDESETA